MKCDETLPKVGQLCGFFFFLVNIFLIIFKVIFLKELLHEK